MDKARVDAEIRSMFERIYKEVGIADYEDNVIREVNREYTMFGKGKLRGQKLINPLEHCVCFEDGRVKWYWPSVVNSFLKYEYSVADNWSQDWAIMVGHDEKFLKIDAIDYREFVISKQTGKSYSESEVIRRMLKGETEL